MVNIKPVRIIKRGNNYQLYYYNPNKERRRLSVGNNYLIAQKLASKFNDWVLESMDPEHELEKVQQAEKARNITLRDFFPEFIKLHGSKQSKSTQKIYHERFKNISRCPQLADIPINNISKRLMLDYMNTRVTQDSVSPATANREATLVKTMLSRATEWDILENNPLKGIKLLKESEKRKVEITPKEAGKLIAELNEPLANITEFAIYTGFRKENILSLRIEQIQFHDLTPTGEVELVIKGGRTEKFPLNPLAVKILKYTIGDRKNGCVFLNPRTKARYHSIHKTFDKAVRKLGLNVEGKKFCFHDLRHVFATWLYKKGVSLDVLRELLGHRDRKTTDRYATLNRIELGQNLLSMPRIIKTPKKKYHNYKKVEVF